MSYTYKEHRKKLLRNKKVREEYEKLLPEHELAKSIISQRLRKKMTQEEVAKKSGMPQSTISRIEGLTHGLPKLETLKKIAAALGVKLVVKLAPKEPSSKYCIGAGDEKPLTIGEARKYYGRSRRK